MTVRVPRGYAADYVLGTTSGDIRLYAIDVDKVKVNTTSGDVRVEPDAGIRARSAAPSFKRASLKIRFSSPEFLSAGNLKTEPPPVIPAQSSFSWAAVSVCFQKDWIFISC